MYCTAVTQSVLFYMCDILLWRLEQQSKKFFGYFQLYLLMFCHAMIEMTVKNATVLLPAGTIAHKREGPVPAHSI